MVCFSVQTFLIIPRSTSSCSQTGMKKSTPQKNPRHPSLQNHFRLAVILVDSQQIIQTCFWMNSFSSQSLYIHTYMHTTYLAFMMMLIKSGTAWNFEEEPQRLFSHFALSESSSSKEKNWRVHGILKKQWCKHLLNALPWCPAWLSRCSDIATESNLNHWSLTWSPHGHPHTQ